VIKRLLVPLALLGLAALAVAACGGGGSSAEDEVTEVIEQAATTKDPSNCTELQTLRFTEQNTGEKGKAAIKSCEESAKEEEQAEEAKVTKVSVNGEKATAEAEFIGGSLGSQTLAVALVEEDGDWKLDQIEGFANYDGKALEETFLKRFEESPEGLTKQQYTCIAEGIGKASTAEAEAMFLSGASTKIEELAKGCA
jgi:ABC-type glycerol-3-phosphate transport system substrate-binding protein